MSELGFPKRRKCVKFLLRFEGDVDKAVEEMKKYYSKEGLENEIKESGYADKIQLLFDRGFTYK